MAKVLVTYWRSDEISANATLNFWDGFFTELCKAGNDVLAINNSFYGIWTSNTTDNTTIESYLLEQVDSFSPDVIIAFNNRILNSIVKKYPDIPLVIYDGDELKFFSDLDGIKKNIGRYKIFTLSKNFINDYLNFGFKKDQIFFMPTATAVHADSTVEQKMNISFLGQRRWYLNNYVSQAIRDGRDMESFYAAYLEHLKTGNFEYAQLFKKNDRLKSETAYSDSDLWPLFDDTYLVLANLLDLGLTLGGHEGGWRDIVDFIPQLATVHKLDRIFTLKENEDFYNSSILSLSPIHPQARGKAYSWRSYDIMASNACLVSSYSSELRELTESSVNLPMYNSPAEARELCIKLLNDTNQRNDIVQASQEFIEKNCRWIQRFKDMEQILGIPLINKEKPGKLIKLPVTIPEEYVKAHKNDLFFAAAVKMCEILDIDQEIRKVNKIKLFAFLCFIFSKKVFQLYEKLANKIKHSLFSNFLIFCLVAILVLYKFDFNFISQNFLTKEILLNIGIIVSITGTVILLLAYLCTPLLCVLKLAKKILKKVVEKLK